MLYDCRSKRCSQVTSGFYNDELPVVRSRRQIPLLPHGPHVRAQLQRAGRDLDLRQHRRARRGAAAQGRRSPRWPRATTRRATRPRTRRRTRRRTRTATRRTRPRPTRSKDGQEGRQEGREGGQARSRWRLTWRASRSGWWCCRPRPGATTTWRRSRASCSTAACRASARASEKKPVVFYDLEKREEKTVIDDVDAFELSADREKLLVARRSDYAIIEPKDGQKMDKKIATGELEAPIDPVRRVAADLQRRLAPGARLLLRPGHARRGLERRCASATASCWRTRDPLGRELRDRRTDRRAELLPHLPQRRRRRERRPAAAWATWAPISRSRTAPTASSSIFQRRAWDSEVRSPLAAAGADNVHEGDYLLAVNGVAAGRAARTRGPPSRVWRTSRCS